jgi:hypothetical protein
MKRTLELDAPDLSTEDLSLVENRLAGHRRNPKSAVPLESMKAKGLAAVTMKWRVEFRPEVELDMAEAAEWYESRQPGLGVEFIEEVVRVWDSLSENPLLNSRRLPNRNIRWRYPDHFP